ncbi:MAG: ABC transporter permease [Candidatus Woesearchaeota archaeon]
MIIKEDLNNMFIDYFKIPLKEMRRRKTRSWLTLIGIFIGIAAIISLITLGQGMENAITRQFEMLGKDKIFISPKGGTFGGMGSNVILTDKDLEIIRKADGVKRATGMGYANGGFEFNNLVRYNFVSGMSLDPEERALIGEAQSYEIAEGRMLQKGDVNKIVLGYEYTQTALFEKRLYLGDKILVNGREFKIVGFLKKIGSPPDDKSGMIPIDTYAELFDAKDELGFIIVQTQPGEEVSMVGDAIKKDLRKYRDLDEGKEDFSVETPEQFAEAFASVLSIVQIVLVGIASISLLVGGIGIMNTMYTSVLQRTKEIGVLKALGARNSHIMYLFLVESGLYGLGGGLIGTVLGLGFAKFVEFIFIFAVGPAFLMIEVNWWLVSGTLFFSFVIGCLSGIAPARQASKMNPVDSLRYE